MSASFSPTASKNGANFLSASFNNGGQQDDAQFNEKTVFRGNQKFPELLSDQQSRCQTSNSSSSSKSRHSHRSSRRNNHLHSAQKQQQQNQNQDCSSIDWPELGVKIEDWFDGARTPDQRIVYKFLNNIKSSDEQGDNNNEINNQHSRLVGSAMTDRSLRSLANNRHHSQIKSFEAGQGPVDNAQSLENILDNLKKYRTKFNKKNESRSYSRRDENEMGGSELPRLQRRSGSVSARPDQQATFESSTWRVMRHLKSADIRNKYPLPKANPDYHFRNATTFHTCGRPPKSTFLLHPDWV